ncbi:hypothetical protein ES288_D13G117800v1 [Gossypium darwinii]|uniref:Nuclear factor related to kappa-B-binding protein second winged helix domain-containing protein n=1 Tax=Gossypium darwinii TaxID=34276 RepID=A0A5D1ZZM7_GOSDA|nr:hypothetical protein ES288_D13G117800v1 [Gossypium darwinii]
MGTSTGEGSAEITERRKLIQRDIDAAIILIQLSNDKFCLLETKLQSQSRYGACNSKGDQDRTEVSGDSTRPSLESINYDVVGEFGMNRSSLLKLKKDGKTSIHGKKLYKSSLEKCGLKKVKPELGSTSVSKVASSTVQETKSLTSEPFQKLQFGLNCPTAHPGFSFSIIHFLSTILTAMITLYAKVDPSASSNNPAENNPKRISRYHFLTMSEIVEQIRSNPGDPCTLKVQESLQELVRDAILILSLTTAPLGSKAWEPHNYTNEAVLLEAWGLPRRKVQKLVHYFVNWLKKAQDSLLKIGDLPAPPLTLMHQTVNEEAVRYLVPERAFSYIALDGKKSTVVPLSSSKPSLKCREHFMLKADRPPNIIILSLVRDAAALLWDRMGIGANFCVLIRDSQYIVEEIPDEQLNQIISEKKLWFYLHRDREEDDFKYDAPLSTRKRRRHW